MPPLSTLVLLLGLALTIPLNLWEGYFPRFVGDYYRLPAAELQLVPALRDPEPGGPRYSVQVPFELLRYSTDLPANALLPPREQGLGAVNVLVRTDYYFTTIRRSAQPSLLIASATLFSWLLLALA